MRLLLVLLSLVSLASAEPDLKPLETWLVRQKDLRSLQADFVQERKLPSLKKPVSTPGRIVMMVPGKLRWELGNPVKTLAVSDGATMTLLDVTKKRGKKLPADAAEARQFSFLSDGAFRDLATFRQVFETVEARMTGPIYQITLKPKDRSMRKHVSWMFLDIDTRNYELRAVDLELDDKSRIRTVFSNAKINAKVAPAAFTVATEGYMMR